MEKLNIAYYRVSTEKQEESGLGLESQKNIVFGYLRKEPDMEFIEAETGTNENREILREAIAKCKRSNGRLIIANLSRLSRSAKFVLELQDSHVDFICCDNPNANPLTIGILAIVAQDYSNTIKVNTRNALKAKVARERLTNPDFRLGCPKGQSAFEKGFSEKGMQPSQIRKAQKEYYDELWNPEVLSLIIKRKEDGESIARIRKFLNSCGFKSPSGGLWYDTTIKNKLDRIKKDENETKQTAIPTEELACQD